MLSGLMENRYTFTTWPALCKTKGDQADGVSPGAARWGCSTHSAQGELTPARGGGLKKDPRGLDF